MKDYYFIYSWNIISIVFCVLMLIFSPMIILVFPIWILNMFIRKTSISEYKRLVITKLRTSRPKAFNEIEKGISSYGIRYKVPKYLNNNYEFNEIIKSFLVLAKSIKLNHKIYIVIFLLTPVSLVRFWIEFGKFFI